MLDSNRLLLSSAKNACIVALFTAALITDQVTKMWARSALDGGPTRPLIGRWLSLRLIHNSGAAFSLGADKTWILTLVTVVIIAFLIVLALRVSRFSTRLAIALLVGGAAGNLVDRLTGEPSFGMGRVTDFISYGDFFVGNVADIWIVVGAAWLVVALSREPSKENE